MLWFRLDEILILLTLPKWIKDFLFQPCLLKWKSIFPHFVVYEIHQTNALNLHTQYFNTLFWELTLLFLCIFVGRNACWKPWAAFAGGDLTIGGVHSDQAHVSHTAASLSHCLYGRVQPPSHTVACHHGTQGIVAGLQAEAFVTLHILSFLMLSFTSSTPKAASAPFSVPVFQPVRPLPAVQFQVERVNVEHSVPMYAPELISIVSNLSQPSDNLLHHCYAHLYLKVSSVTILIALSWFPIPRPGCIIACIYAFTFGKVNQTVHV